MTYREDLMTDLTGIDVPTMHDIIDDRMAADRDYSPVPAEFRDMSWFEIVEIIDEAEREAAYAHEAMEQIPHRWQ